MPLRHALVLAVVAVVTVGTGFHQPDYDTVWGPASAEAGNPWQDPANFTTTCVEDRTCCPPDHVVCAHGSEYLSDCEDWVFCPLE